jgi:hypothetical protein
MAFTVCEATMLHRFLKWLQNSLAVEIKKVEGRQVIPAFEATRSQPENLLMSKSTIK